jgi:hypothetical protein
VQAAAHELGLILPTQSPPQSCVPLGQTPMHAWALAMQSFAQIFCPLGQVAPQVPFVHVALPPLGAAHGEHEEPQDAIEVLSPQTLPPQRWYPVEHEIPHTCAALQVAVPFAAAGQSAAVQQVPLAMQAPAHRW